LARGLGVPFQGLWLDAPVEVLERRIASRRDDASDAGIAVMRQQTIFAERPSGWAMIDAAASPDAMAATAAKILGLPPGMPSAT